MSKVTWESVRGVLPDLSKPVEIIDANGKVVARVFPVFDLTEYEPWEPPISDEELRRIEQSNQKRYTTAEVLKHLEKL